MTPWEVPILGENLIKISLEARINLEWICTQQNILLGNDIIVGNYCATLYLV